MPAKLTSPISIQHRTTAKFKTNGQYLFYTFCY